MFAKSRLNSERGSIVLGALAVATLIAVFAGTIATQIKSADDMTQLPRIRATMAQIEVQTRLAAFSATSYACAYGDPDNTASYACSLKAELFRNISAKVDGGMIRMKQDPTWSETTSRFNAEIVFVQDATATKRFQIAPRVLDLEIPSEILQPVTFKCPDSRPIFAGYRSVAAADGTFKKGEAICKALDNTVCAPGEYIASIDPATLKPTCAPAGRNVSCPANQYFSTFQWNGAGSLNYGCTDRKNPFTEMGWNFLPNMTIDTAFNSRDPDSPNPTPPPLPGNDVVTWTAPATQPASVCYVPPPVNCSGAFSACSATCGGGTQTYIISQAAQNGGAACAFTSGQTQACNTQACVPATPTPGPSTCQGSYEDPNPMSGNSAYTCTDCSFVGNEEVIEVFTCDIGQCGPRPILPSREDMVNAVRAQVTSSGGNPNNFTYNIMERSGGCPSPGCDAWFPQTMGRAYACPITAATPAPTPASTPAICRDTVIYHPCRSTSCMTNDYTCPAGKVIQKWKVGNIWGANALINWTGPIASLCVDPQDCIPTAATPAPTASCPYTILFPTSWQNGYIKCHSLGSPVVLQAGESVTLEANGGCDDTFTGGSGPAMPDGGGGCQGHLTIRCDAGVGARIINQDCSM